MFKGTTMMKEVSFPMAVLLREGDYAYTWLFSAAHPTSVWAHKAWKSRSLEADPHHRPLSPRTLPAARSDADTLMVPLLVLRPSRNSYSKVLRVCPERLFPTEPPEHQPDHCDADEGNGGSEVLLVMAYEASAACEP